MSIRDGRDRRGVKSEKDWAQDGPLGHTRSNVRGGEQASPILTDCRRLCRYEEIQSRARPVRPKQEERRLMVERVVVLQSTQGANIFPPSGRATHFPLWGSK